MHSNCPPACVEFCGQLHNRESLLAQLGLPLKVTSDEVLLQVAWQHWGESLASRLLGDFALAINDPVRRLTYLVRHPLGIKPLYYRIDQGRLHHAFSIPELQRRCPQTITPDMDWVVGHILRLNGDAEQTAYREIQRVPPGHWLTYDGNGKVRLQRYHEWQDDAPWANKRDPSWVQAYQKILEEAIRCRMPLESAMGSENSGGLDSATITAYLAHFLGVPGDRLHCFGFALFVGEPEYILDTAQKHRILHNYVLTAFPEKDESDEVILRNLEILGYPAEHGHAAHHQIFYRECQQRKIPVLFSGFGGDEVGTNQGFHAYWELLAHRNFRSLWAALPGNSLGRSLRLLKYCLARKSSSNLYATTKWNARWADQLLRPEVVDRLDLDLRYMESARFDSPFRRVNDFILQRYLGRQHTVARLENCTTMAAAYGVDYRWPMWDIRLVQQYLSTPSIEKIGPRGMGRYLHRKAVDHLLPAPVVWKRSKAMVKTAGYVDYMEKRKRASWQAHFDLADNLHPAFADMLDLKKMGVLIKGMAEGQFQSTERQLSVSLHLERLRTLSLWLQHI